MQGEEQLAVEEIAPPVVVPKAKKPATTTSTATVEAPQPREVSPELRAMARKTDQSLTDWMTALRGADGALRVSIKRLKPKEAVGPDGLMKNIFGHIETVEGALTEDQIREEYGGGVYQVKALTPGPQGNYVYRSGTTIEIAGEPRLDRIFAQQIAAAAREESHAPMKPAPPDPMVDRMFSALERRAEKSEEKLDQAMAEVRHGGRSNMAEIQLMLKPFEIQIAALTEAIRAKDIELAEMRKQPQLASSQEKMLDKLIDGDSARVRAVTEQLQSEIRMIKEHATDTEKRLRDQHERDLDRAEKRFDAQIASLKDSHALTLATTKMNYDMQIKLLEHDRTGKQTELVELKSEVKTLRDKKDPSLKDKIEELNNLKELIGGDEEESSGIGKIVEVVANSKEAMGMFGRMFGPAQQAQAQQQTQAVQRQQKRRPRVVKNKDTGELWQDDGQGGWTPVTQPQAQAAGAEAPAAEVQISDEDKAKAVLMLETAYRNNTNPENLATTVQTMIPEAILQAIHEHGVDGFLVKVAKLPSTSPLNSMAGKNWIRKFGKALVGEASS